MDEVELCRAAEGRLGTHPVGRFLNQAVYDGLPSPAISTFGARVKHHLVFCALEEDPLNTLNVAAQRPLQKAASAGGLIKC